MIIIILCLYMHIYIYTDPEFRQMSPRMGLGTKTELSKKGFAATRCYCQLVSLFLANAVLGTVGRECVLKKQHTKYYTGVLCMKSCWTLPGLVYQDGAILADLFAEAGSFMCGLWLGLIRSCKFVGFLVRRLVSSCLRMPRVPACHELMQSELGFSNPEPVCPFQLWSSETAGYRKPQIKKTEEFVNFSNFSLIIFGAQKPPMKLSQVYKHSFGLCFTKELSITARGLNEKNPAVWAACGSLGRFTQLEADPDLGPPLMHAWMLSQILRCFWFYFSFSINFIWFIHFSLFPFALFLLFSTAKLQAIHNMHNTWFCNSRCMLQMPDIFWFRGENCHGLVWGSGQNLLLLHILEP